ncbi:MAG: tRNA pseudouridine(13) synthase TruD, partial [Gemmataceae bacterium]|nr:tRNA pseudouridine(13) synthase TruD [Gemmataceae bacterium]
MKVKQSAEDFQVEELTDIAATGHGPFALYRLDKRGWSTPDAMQALRRRWKIEPRRLAFGGLKDRHARTIQYLTIFHGPQRNLTHQEVHVKYLGQVTEPYTSKDIRANRFKIALRAVEPAALPSIAQALDELRREGVPNYFDDQRFGSVADGEFVGRALVRGEFEEALRLALVAPYEHDRASQKREKTILREHWGNWAACRQQLPRGDAFNLADYLAVHPGDFRGALARLQPELRILLLSAYQSHLWNRMLARWLRDRCRPEQLLAVSLRLGEVPMHRGLDATVL